MARINYEEKKFNSEVGILWFFIIDIIMGFMNMIMMGNFDTMNCIVGLIMGIVPGIIVYFIAGSLTQKSVYFKKKIFCSSCGQLLGWSNDFNENCNRCGSNRYTDIDPGAQR